jgi:bifunctional polynucleotide phosphatase/kinase
MFRINPEVEKCYKKNGIAFDKIADIVRKNDSKFQTEGTCVYHIPRDYVPKSYVFALDLDNTLTYHEKTLYVKHADDIHILPDRYEVLQKIFKMGYTIVVFTNQSTMNAATAMKRMQNFLVQVNLPIYVFAALKKDKYRKPDIGMWNLFLNKSGITPEKIYFSGDALGREFDFANSDKEFAENIGATIFTPEEVFGEFDPNSIPKRKKEVVLFVGPPGANKTTLYKQKYADYVHVNKDTQKTREMSVYKMALKNGQNIVVDDTNPTKEVRDTFIASAKALGYSITILYFVKAGHNYNDKRVKKVPDLVYHVFFKKLEVPTEEEGDTYLVW